jgi:hypothetical protein
LSSYTFEDLLQDARLYSDERPGGDLAFISDTDGYRLIVKAIKRLRSDLNHAGGHEWFATSFTHNLEAGTSVYALPEYHAQTILLQIQRGDRAEDLEPWEWGELAALKNRRRGRSGYRIIAGNIEIYPAPSEAVDCLHIYVPSVESYGWTPGGDDAWDGLIDGWEEWVALDVASVTLEIQNLDSGSLIRRRNESHERIMEMAYQRTGRDNLRMVDMNQPGALGQVDYLEWV